MAKAQARRETSACSTRRDHLDILAIDMGYQFAAGRRQRQLFRHPLGQSRISTAGPGNAARVQSDYNPTALQACARRRAISRAPAMRRNGPSRVSRSALPRAAEQRAAPLPNTPNSGRFGPRAISAACRTARSSSVNARTSASMAAGSPMVPRAWATAWRTSLSESASNGSRASRDCRVAESGRGTGRRSSGPRSCGLPAA